MIDLKLIQNALVERRLDGWLLYDYKGVNPHALRLLGLSSEKLKTRRFFYWIPNEGEPVKLVSRVENPLINVSGKELFFGSAEELRENLGKILKPGLKIAMEYVEGGFLPEISRVDGGTLDLVRSFGVEIVSSGDLLQLSASKISGRALQTHLEAASALDQIAALAFAFIEKRLSFGVSEIDVQRFMLQEMERRGLEAEHPPICAINAHSADPHFEPKEGGEQMKRGDFVLIDLWCRKKEQHSIYADITRVASIGPATTKQKEIFAIVRRAQEEALAYVQERYAKGELLRGFDVDRKARRVIEEAGYGPFFVHRLGHNIHEKDHGPGAHLDSFETLDTRELLPGTCFSIEPGIYLPGEFGVRLEFDVFLDPSGKAVVTGGVQDSLAEISL